MSKMIYIFSVTGTANAAGHSKSMGETIRGIRGMNLKQKLFRLKNIDGLQDTEENQDDSELKVISSSNSSAILNC